MITLGTFCAAMRHSMTSHLQRERHERELLEAKRRLREEKEAAWQAETERRMAERAVAAALAAERKERERADEEARVRQDEERAASRRMAARQALPRRQDPAPVITAAPTSPRGRAVTRADIDAMAAAKRTREQQQEQERLDFMASVIARRQAKYSR